MSLEKAGNDDLTRLTRDIRLGFGGDVDVSIIDTHHSKSQRLPIVAASREGWNTSVAWYAFNYHNHYAAYRLKRPLPATLLAPISGTLGRKHLSGHEVDCPLPDVTNFAKAYWERQRLDGFACFAGDWHMATTLRYLEAASSIDQRDLFDVVMDRTRYGAVDRIDGNAIDFKALCQVTGVPGPGSFQRDVVVPPNRVVESIKIDWFGIDTDVRPCAVEVVAKPGMLLPATSGTGEVYVDARDTRLGDVLGDEHQLRWSEDTKYNDARMLNFVPVSMFRYWSRSQEDYVARRRALDATPWRASHVYNVASLATRRVRFAVDNPLDAILFVKWWLEAAIPAAEASLADQTVDRLVSMATRHAAAGTQST